MDLANGRDDDAFLNGGVGAEETMRRRRRMKVEMVQEVIHGFLEKRRDGQGGENGLICQRDEEERLLSSLLTKLDELEKDPDSDVVEPHSVHHPGNGEQSKAVKLPDIAKDLNKIKRQNTITHLLLGTVIVLTAVWQVNEVSFLLWVQSKLSNPFKSLGDMIKASLKLRGRRPVTMESSLLPPVGVPDVSRADLPTLVIGGTGTEGRVGQAVQFVGFVKVEIRNLFATIIAKFQPPGHCSKHRFNKRGCELRRPLGLLGPKQSGPHTDCHLFFLHVSCVWKEGQGKAKAVAATEETGTSSVSIDRLVEFLFEGNLKKWAELIGSLLRYGSALEHVIPLAHWQHHP
ncbi:hypothetical protein U9M48_023380, partial [Paspalum notatum var. saurae]